MIRSFVLFAFLLVSTSAFADKVACTIDGQDFNDPDFCQAIKVSHEAFQLHWQLLEKGKSAQKSLKNQLDEKLNDTNTKPRP